MAVINDTYPYVNGDTLDAAGHNSNLDNPTVSGGGIISEHNGSIEAVNFDDAFSVQSYHISPGAMVWTASREATITRDYYGDIFGGSDQYQYITIDAVRFRVPFNAGFAMISASAFISPFLWRTTAGDNGTIYHGARTALFFNQLKDVESEFVLPHNANAVSAGTNPLRKRAGRYAVPRTHFKFITDASQLLKGTFEIGLKLAIDSETNAPATVSYPRAQDIVGEDNVNRTLHVRVSIGSVNISAIFFKNANS